MTPRSVGTRLPLGNPACPPRGRTGDASATGAPYHTHTERTCINVSRIEPATCTHRRSRGLHARSRGARFGHRGKRRDASGSTLRARNHRGHAPELGNDERAECTVCEDGNSGCRHLPGRARPGGPDRVRHSDLHARKPPLPSLPDPRASPRTIRRDKCPDLAASRRGSGPAA